MAGITNTAISRFDMDPTCNINEGILKSLGENDFIHMHLTRVFSQSSHDNADLGINLGDVLLTYTVEDISFHTKAEQKADAILSQSYNDNC